MKVPFNDLVAQWKNLTPAIKTEINTIIDSGMFVECSANKEFEIKLKSLHNVKNAIGVSDGTSALYLLLKGWDIGPGDEVIFPTNTFIATAFAISKTGAKPVPCDVGSDGLMNVETVKERMNGRTKAIVVVHLFGCAVDIEQFKPLNVMIFEDGAQSIGNTYANMGQTTFGASISFYPGKNLGAFGQAGGILVNNDDVAKKIKNISNQGQVAKYNHKYKGGNYRLDSIQAIALNHGIDKINAWNKARQDAAALYNQLVPAELQIVTDPQKSIYHVYPILLPATVNRDNVIENLSNNDINTSIHYPIPVHKSDAYPELSVYECKQAEYICSRLLSLPMFTTITEDQIKYVVENLKKEL